MRAVKRVFAVLAGIWASFGVWLLIRAVLAFARGQLPASPNVVSSALVMLFINLGIPCIALFLLLREPKQPWEK
jgi:hypothetical protein